MARKRSRITGKKIIKMIKQFIHGGRYLVFAFLFIRLSAYNQTAFFQATTDSIVKNDIFDNPYQIATVENLHWFAATDQVVTSPNRLARWSAHYQETTDNDASAIGRSGLEWNAKRSIRNLVQATPAPQPTYLANAINGLTLPSFDAEDLPVSREPADYRHGSVGTLSCRAAGLTAGAATQYLVTASTTAPLQGSAVTITAQLADAGNNAVATAGKTVTWTKSGANGRFAAATSPTDANGIATVVFTSHTVAGTATTVTATDNTSLTGTSATITTILRLYAIGGTETVITEGGKFYRVHTFTDVGTSELKVLKGGDVEYLVVGGGGAGGSSPDICIATGGGAGGAQVLEGNVV